MVRVAADMLSVRKRNSPWHGLVVRDQVDVASEEGDDAGTRGPGDATTEESPRPPLAAAPRRSLVVERVEANGPAARAGLQRGDVVVRVGEAQVACGLELERALLDSAAGDRVPVVVRRSGAEHKVELVLQALDRSAPSAGELVWRKLGLRLQTVNAEQVSRTNQQLHGGLVVTDVRAEGAAGKAGIQRGDILVGLHQWEMLAPENVVFVLTHPDLASFNPLRFYIVRSGQVHRGWLQQVE